MQEKYLPTPEKQRHSYTVNDQKKIFDTMGCVSESGTNVLEYRSNLKMDTGEMIIDDVVKDYLDENSKFNASGREVAKRSGTTENGNHGYIVANTISNGLVPESMWPWPEPGKDGYVDWDEYYAPLEGLQEQRKIFNKHFDVPWKWVTSFKSKLDKGTPFQGYVYAWVRNKNRYGGLYYRPEGKDSNHAIMVVDYEKDNEGGVAYWIIFDTYEPFIKHVHPNNLDNRGIEFDILPLKTMNIEKFKKENVNNIIRNKETGAYGAIYQSAEDGKITAYHITQKRAGLFVLDREARGIIGEAEKVEVKDSTWKALKPKKF